MREQPTMKQILPTALIVVFLGIAMLVSTGCSSNPDAARYAYQTSMGYYNQPNTANVLHIKTGEGGKASLTLEGDAELTLNTPVPTKSIIPRDPGIMHDIFGFLKAGVIGYFLNDSFNAATSTRTVTTPAPQVVRPEIIQVPFAPAP